MTIDGPRVAAGFPQAFLDAGDLAVPALGELRETVRAVEAGGGVLDDDRRSELRQLLTTLRQTWAGNRQSIAGLQASAVSFTSTVHALHDPLAADIASAMATLTSDQATVAELADRIAALQNDLGGATGSARTAETGADVSGAQLSLAVILFSVGTRLVPVIGIGISLISIGVTVFLTTRHKQRVLEALEAIGQLEERLTAEQIQIAALHGILAGLDALHEAADATGGGLQDALPAWDGLLGEVDDLLELLDQPQLDLGRVSALSSPPRRSRHGSRSSYARRTCSPRG